MTTKRTDYVFCVDSDGCAMDTMTYKHQLFFGPLAAEFFNVVDKDTFLKEWDRVNLYSRTRGVNRFVGLVMGLEFAGIDNITALKHWVETTSSLSNASLESEIAKQASPDLEQALAWSYEVNRQIKAYDGPVRAFDGVKESLAALQQLGKVYIVSSANKEAVVEEWENLGLIDHVDDLYCQDRGKKEDVIAELLASGYEPSRLIMVGDSPGDLAAAEQNGVAFYPIIVGDEASSWQTLREQLAPAFVSGQFSAQEQTQLKTRFWQNLDQ